MMLFSVCMSVYQNDSPKHFLTAVRSIWNQTLPPDEIILVVDGPVSEDIQSSISQLVNEIPVLKVIQYPENKGHAFARQTGLGYSRNNLCAVMDSDDIAEPCRFEKQLQAFEQHPEVSVVGGLISEFINEPENVVGRRLVPEKDEDIKHYMKSRCPMNLVTVMLKKNHAIKAGGFQDWYCEEDYYLWLRMAMAGFKFYNVQENLVNVRVGSEMYRRRGGKRYFLSEARLQRYMLDNHIIGYPRYVYNVAIRFILQVLMPNRIRGWVFRTFARG